ncbi:MAG: hypothetical protein ACPGWR_15480 [Ardenticatenaceae bacterium]
MRQELRSLREGWDEVRKIEAELMQPLTIQESVRQYVELYETFLPHLEETEPIFRPLREAHLIEIQKRLQRLAEWQRKKNANIDPKRSTDSKTTR